jgi:hypothetical protein
MSDCIRCRDVLITGGIWFAPAGFPQPPTPAYQLEVGGGQHRAHVFISRQRREAVA